VRSYADADAARASLETRRKWSRTRRDHSVLHRSRPRHSIAQMSPVRTAWPESAGHAADEQQVRNLADISQEAIGPPAVKPMPDGTPSSTPSARAVPSQDDDVQSRDERAPLPISRSRSEALSTARSASEPAGTRAARAPVRHPHGRCRAERPGEPISTECGRRACRRSPPEPRGRSKEAAAGGRQTCMSLPRRRR